FNVVRLSGKEEICFSISGVIITKWSLLSNNWAEVTKIKRDLCKNVVKLIIMRHIYISQGKLKMALNIHFTPLE
ncbi:MAG: hypothetical protein KAW19_11325, partial [Candidatus Aminicenantes bacterium]|nr:hypothetical protein [Candidatus Aminicenantes bacterium]